MNAERDNENSTVSKPGDTGHAALAERAISVDFVEEFRELVPRLLLVAREGAATRGQISSTKTMNRDAQRHLCLVSVIQDFRCRS